MAAEFFGTCQICGRQQKAHPHAIAKHGYTIRDGWQEGACYGSGGKPYELSCDLIDGAIAAAQNYITETNAKIADLKANPLPGGTTQAMKSEYHARIGTLSYPVEVTVKLDDGTGLPVAVDRRGEAIKKWMYYDGVKTVESAIAELAKEWIKRLRHHIKKTEFSLDYMRDRKDKWKLAELRPVTAADRAKDAPKLHMKAAKGIRAMCSSTHASGYKATTEDRSKVTCAACLKELARLDDLPRLKAEQAERERQRALKEAERDIKLYQKWIKGGGTDQDILHWSNLLTRATNTLEELKAAAPAAQ